MTIKRARRPTPTHIDTNLREVVVGAVGERVEVAKVLQVGEPPRLPRARHLVCVALTVDRWSMVDTINSIRGRPVV